MATTTLPRHRYPLHTDVLLDDVRTSEIANCEICGTERQADYTITHKPSPTRAKHYAICRQCADHWMAGWTMQELVDHDAKHPQAAATLPESESGHHDKRTGRGDATNNQNLHPRARRDPCAHL